MNRLKSENENNSTSPVLQTNSTINILSIKDNSDSSGSLYDEKSPYYSTEMSSPGNRSLLSSPIRRTLEPTPSKQLKNKYFNYFIFLFTNRFNYLLLMTISMAGLGIAGDLPISMKIYLNQQMSSDITSYEYYYNLLFTVYYLPNVIIPFYGSDISERFGIDLLLPILSFLILLSQFFFTLGVIRKAWWLLYFSRILLGITSDYFILNLSIFLTKKFQKKDLFICFIFIITIYRMGCIIVYVLPSNILFNKMGVIGTCWMSTAFNFFSFISIILLIFIQKIEKKLFDSNNDECEVISFKDLEYSKQKRMCEYEYEYNPMLRFGGFVIISKDLTGARTVTTSDGNDPLIFLKHGIMHVIHRQSPEIYFKKFRKSFKKITETVYDFMVSSSRLFWLVLVAAALVISSVHSFQNIALSFYVQRDFYQIPNYDICQVSSRVDSGLGIDYSRFTCFGANTEKWGGGLGIRSESEAVAVMLYGVSCMNAFCDGLVSASKAATTVMSIPDSVAVVVGLLLSLSLYEGILATFLLLLSLLLAPFLLLLAHVLLGFSTLTPYLPSILIGIVLGAFPIALTIIIPYLPHTLSRPTSVETTYHMIISSINLCLSIYPLLIAVAYTFNHNTYIPSTPILFIITATISLAVISQTVYKIYDDFKKNGEVSFFSRFWKLNAATISLKGQERALQMIGMNPHLPTYQRISPNISRNSSIRDTRTLSSQGEDTPRSRGVIIHHNNLPPVSSYEHVRRAEKCWEMLTLISRRYPDVLDILNQYHIQDSATLLSNMRTYIRDDILDEIPDGILNDSVLIGLSDLCVDIRVNENRYNYEEDLDDVYSPYRDILNHRGAMPSEVVVENPAFPSSVVPGAPGSGSQEVKSGSYISELSMGSLNSSDNSYEAYLKMMENWAGTGSAPQTSMAMFDEEEEWEGMRRWYGEGGGDRGYIYEGDIYLGTAGGDRG